MERKHGSAFVTRWAALDHLASQLFIATNQAPTDARINFPIVSDPGNPLGGLSTIFTHTYDSYGNYTRRSDGLALTYNAAEQTETVVPIPGEGGAAGEAVLTSFTTASSTEPSAL